MAIHTLNSKTTALNKQLRTPHTNPAKPHPITRATSQQELINSKLIITNKATALAQWLSSLMVQQLVNSHIPLTPLGMANTMLREAQTLNEKRLNPSSQHRPQSLLHMAPFLTQQQLLALLPRPRGHPPSLTRWLGILLLLLILGQHPHYPSILEPRRL
jgi:hypothetical protein